VAEAAAEDDPDLGPGAIGWDRESRRQASASPRR
jgi:hypothetical protein